MGLDCGALGKRLSKRWLIGRHFLLALLPLFALLHANAQPITPEEFAAITNMDVNRISFFPPTHYVQDPGQQSQINAFALGLAKEIARGSVETNAVFAVTNKMPYQSEMLQVLCEQGFLTEPAVIPSLIETMKHCTNYANYSCAENSLRSLSLMTRRMWGAVGYGGGEYSLINNPPNQERIVAWWEEWWKDNQHKHPVYDGELEQKVQSEFLQMEQVIENSVKPQFTVLKWFSAETNLPRMTGLSSGTLNERRYEPFQSQELQLSEADIWLEIACRFQYPEMPAKDPAYRSHHPPSRLEKFTTKVASRPINGSDIVIEVEVATPDKALVDALKKELAP